MVFLGHFSSLAAQESTEVHEFSFEIGSPENEINQQRGIFSHGILNPNFAVHPYGQNTSIWENLFCALKFKYSYFDSFTTFFQYKNRFTALSSFSLISTSSSLFLKVCCLRI
jgi:hypothetical protein